MSEPMTVDQMIGLLEAYDFVMPVAGKNVWYPQYTAESVDKFKTALAEHIQAAWQQFKARIKEEK